LIKILPQHIANRIAAGEVIGRPEAVVKELIENSIDAGASRIKLIVKDAGKSIIQVIDDGSGMSEDDALLSFQRHATSKISEAEDLESIKTLGFRGEALASVCAVAQVELKTKREEDELGVLVKNHGSEVLDVAKIRCDTGTSVTVRNLFYNTPARRNFLKSNQTEFRHIYETFIRLAIANHSKAFSFINEDELLFDLEPSGLNERLFAVYGNELREKLVSVNKGSDVISLTGFISKPSFSRKTKQDQLLFLNGRFVISKPLSYAVHVAYGDMIEKGDYPDFFLFLNIGPHRFDVNVHPSKLEVKFEDEKSVFGFIKSSIEKTLEENDLVVKTELAGSSIFDTKGDISFTSPVQEKRDFNHSFSFSKPTVPKQENEHLTRANVLEMYGSFKKEFPEEAGDKGISELPAEQSSQQPAGKNTIWQFNKKYILYQLQDMLMVIDQHAAHERILYEQALERLNSNANLSQQLLMPITIEFNPVDFEVLKSIETEIRALGFDFDILAGRKIKLKGVPSDVKLGNENRVLKELIDLYKENDVKHNLEKRDNLAKTYACKHAIKAGDYLKENEMLNLIDNLFLSKMPYVCPHGRPTIIKIPISELDKKFARTGF
jgi:DNA mismatch repair protein MutL